MLAIQMVKDIAEGFIRVLRSNLVSSFETQSPVVKSFIYINALHIQYTHTERERGSTHT